MFESPGGLKPLQSLRSLKACAGITLNLPIDTEDFIKLTAYFYLRSKMSYIRYFQFWKADVHNSKKGILLDKSTSYHNNAAFHAEFV
jgi:hypothetical protein